ncbi:MULTISPECIES: glutathione S-transferase N-terminal domain-containing protein [Pseudoxanthomonas]|jgi:glutathione S-transferase|uniref:glutathione S-transferase N-terminal domain-containing protein n=1 Tax=Pseudoxanthomonas TaxID=83618 RepID=UPI00161A3CBC|nr:MULTISPECIES: glutathione S-transferase N-terminal domain-containing protein [Pseudoxanthomonas]MBB3275244.1 glutathione S-transferase [Pseudoxanthomonas sp. OG2]MBD9378989.1 glutathione S-transferase N-terminal domain-containing protein [Pseudoxanthomonas sp. PXM04]MBV7473665.1 glutathione S-transferase N-terminal domain-containing protein [Pseudoxanthomonas sp. PXM05]UBB24177.1 glutathione S-transferase N-terminal domain-containing protein [Pseudoxanthomonas japonensis]
MKLYSKPGACSTADHIALQWTGQPFELKVMTAAEMKAPEYLAINPTGAVPAIVDGDFVLTQNAAIMGYIADRYPQAGLGGDGSAQQRAEAARWLSFVNSDVHPAFTPLFAPGKFIADESEFDAIKATARKRLRGLFESANQRLEGRQWLAGFRSFADPYLYITLRWAGNVGVDLGGLDNLAAFRQRMEADPGVQAALKAEGLH